MIAICREVNRSTGEVAAYSLDMEVTNATINYLKLRAKMNQELRYFVTTKGRWMRWREEIQAFLELPEVTKDMIDRIGGIIEL